MEPPPPPPPAALISRAHLAASRGPADGPASSARLCRRPGCLAECQPALRAPLTRAQILSGRALASQPARLRATLEWHIGLSGWRAKGWADWNWAPPARSMVALVWRDQVRWLDCSRAANLVAGRRARSLRCARSLSEDAGRFWGNKTTSGRQSRARSRCNWLRGRRWKNERH